MSQVRDLRSEVRGQKSEARDRILEGSNQASNVNSQPSITPSAQSLNSASHRSSTKADQLPVAPKPGEGGSTDHKIALLTAGRDRPYALGLASALIAQGVCFDFIGSNEVSSPELHSNSHVRFLDFRDQRADANAIAKVLRVVAYYWRLVRYTANAHPKVFHILWNNKFELFDRTLLMLYYKLMGKRLTFTAHNVNAAKRDSNDSFLNRFSLRTQYGLSDHIFVHTEAMKNELLSEFGVSPKKVSVVPFGINNTVPNTGLSVAEAKQRLGVTSDNKTMLFFGNIAPYKGLSYLVDALAELFKRDESYRLIIAGKPKGNEAYWNKIRQTSEYLGARRGIIEKIEYVPDEETELYFKAADVLVLPYTRIFQSGVIFLGYAFGLPVIAADVGTLTDEIIEGETGFLFRPQDSSDLAKTIRRYFESDLFRNLEIRRSEIKAYANERYSWDKVAAITTAVYSDLLSNG